MSSLRLQIIGIIVAIALLIIIVGVGAGMILMRKSLVALEKDSLKTIADITDTLITSELDRLKLYLKSSAADIAFASDENIQKVLNEYNNADLGIGDVTFSALTVIKKGTGKKGTGEEEGAFEIIAQKGKFSVPGNLLIEPPDYVTKAFEGHSVISTTVQVVQGNYPKVVFFVCVPLKQEGSGQDENGDVQRILCGTLDGTHFIELLGRSHIWGNKSDIVICDSEGVLIAAIFPELIPNRVNYILEAKKDPVFQSLGNFFSQMISGQTGFSEHVLRGEYRLGYYRPVSGSRMGWALSATAPMHGDPSHEATVILIITVAICLALSTLVAFFVSGFLAKQYRTALEAKDSAERASESKSAFLANMSHEMRTPLNAVIGLSELAIGSGEANPEIVGDLEKIYSSGMTLLGIINDLLDISKIEAGKLELIPVEYDLPSLINDMTTLNSVRVGSKPIKFLMEVDEHLPTKLIGDELRIKQVLNNVLSNAFKYTIEGVVNWSISCEEEKDKFYLVFKITDTGIGIRKEDIANLFAKYHRLDAKANRQIEGTGLGLTLVKRMVELMNGTIAVESEYGHGSTFTVRIQQQKITEETIGKSVAYNLAHMRHSQNKLARNARLIRVKLPYARVLVVDDVQTNLDVARGLLKPYQIHVDCVISGQQAIDAMRNEDVRYNAIFMDHMMPGMDGFEAARRIREIGTDYAKSIPIIALTANAIVGNEELFLRRGFQAFLSKPIDIMRLDIEIRRWIRDKAQETDTQSESSLTESVLTESSLAEAQGVSTTNRAASKSDWTIEGLDKERGLAQFSNSEEMYRMILKSYIDNTPDLLDQIRSCTESQLPDYAVVVHGIKGTSYAICAEAVGKRAESLELAARRGDIQYVLQHNAVFIREAEALIERIKAVL